MDGQHWKCVECKSVFKNKWPQCPTCDGEELVSVSGDSNPKVITTVEINPMNKLNNLTELKHLEPISEHLWWLALLAKISLGMMILSIIGAILLGA